MKICNWGKYRGTAMGDLPDSYIHWCLQQFEPIDPNRAIVLEEYNRRAQQHNIETQNINEEWKHYRG